MPRFDARLPFVRSRHRELTLAALAEVFAAQADDIRARVDARASTSLLPAHWDAELAAVILDRNRDAASDAATRAARAFGADFDTDLMDEWLQLNAGITAEAINTATRDQLADVDDPDGCGEVLDGLMDVRRPSIATSMTTGAIAFGARDGARAAGATAKTWRVNSGNPRSSHAGVNGETVEINRAFSNGLMWPGDSSGGAEEVANCECSLELL